MRGAAADLTMMRNGFTALEGTEEPVSEHNLFSIELTMPADCGYGMVDGSIVFLEERLTGAPCMEQQAKLAAHTVSLTPQATLRLNRRPTSILKELLKSTSH